MKNLIAFSIICFFCCSCTFNNKESITSFLVTPKENISMVLDSFVKVNECKNCFFEIYIDKQTPEEYISFIYCGNQPLIYREKQISIMHAIISNVKFDIYSGVENFFEMKKDLISKDESIPVFSDEGRALWVVKDSANIITVEDYYHAYPFVPLPGNSEKYFNIIDN